MSDSKSSGRGGLAILGLICWIIHWWVTDVPRTSDASFFDGLVHGLSVNVSALRRSFGAEIGVRDYHAKLAYELGLSLGVSLLLLLFNAFVEATVNRIFGVDHRQAVFVLVIGTGLAALGLGVGLVFAEHWSPPFTAAEDIPPLMGVISGRVWQAVSLVGLNVMTGLVLLLGVGAALSGLGKDR